MLKLLATLTATILVSTFLPASAVVPPSDYASFDVYSQEAPARTPKFLTSLGVEAFTAEAAQQGCCKICSIGKACGNTCISRDKVCHVGRGCACDG